MLTQTWMTLHAHDDTQQFNSVAESYLNKLESTHTNSFELSQSHEFSNELTSSLG